MLGVIGDYQYPIKFHQAIKILLKLVVIYKTNFISKLNSGTQKMAILFIKTKELNTRYKHEIKGCPSHNIKRNVYYSNDTIYN